MGEVPEILHYGKVGLFLNKNEAQQRTTGERWFMVRKSIYFFVMLMFGSRVAAQLPEVSAQALDELGSTYGVPQMNGFVFIEGRYVPPPYTVTRKGNGIFINRIQVEQPMRWPIPALTGAEGEKKAVDSDGDFEEVAAPAAPVPAGAPADEAVAAPAKAKAVKSIDDLFADDGAPAEADAPAVPSQAPAAPVAVPETKAVAPQMGVQPERAPEDAEREKAAAAASLDRIRKGYEQSLTRGDMFFFGQRHNRVNGNYGTACALMGVLPKALRYADSPNDLYQRLTQGGVYFIDIAICAELFRNKNTFPMLEDRLRKIEEAKALEAKKRRPSTVW